MNIGRPTIALIEDDPFVRGALATALVRAEYNVISAASGPEGLAVLESQDIDVAIIDIVMPGRMGGISLAKEAKRSNPGLRVIFTSGGPPPDPEELSSLGPFVPKSAAIPTLLATIAEQLRRAD